MGCGASSPASTPAARVSPPPAATAMKPAGGAKKPGGGVKFAAGGGAPTRTAGGPRLDRRDSVRRPGVSAEPFKVRSEEVSAPDGRRSSMTHARSSIVIDNSTVIATVEKPPEIINILKAATDDNPLFAKLTPEQKRVVYGAMADEEYDAGEKVIAQGERGDLFYVVESGTYDAFVNDEVVRHYASGTGFGELALLFNSPRAATIKCVTGGRLWAIDRSVFNMIMVSSNKAAFTRAQEFLRSTALLEGLEASAMDFLATSFEEYVYTVGETLWDAGDAVDTLFLVREGDVEIFAEPDPSDPTATTCPGAPGDPEPTIGRRGSVAMAPTAPMPTGANGAGGGGGGRRNSVSLTKQAPSQVRKVVTLGRGDWFGSAALEPGSGDAAAGGAGGGRSGRESLRHVRDSSVHGVPTGYMKGYDGDNGARHRTSGRALNRVTVLELRRSTLRSAKEDAVGSLPTQLLQWVLRNAEAALTDFLALAPVQRTRLLAGLPATGLAANEILEQPDLPTPPPEGGPRTTACHQCLVNVCVRGAVRLAPSSVTDGATCDADPLASQVCEMGACANPEGLSRPVARQLEEASGSEAMVVSLDTDLLVSLRANMSTVARRTDESDADGSVGAAEVLSLDELQHTAILGAGGYGSVCLVQHTSTQRFYALKKMSKPHVVSKRQVDHVNSERKLLGQCDHPFIIELCGAFQDRDYLYLLLELVLGGELFAYLDDHGPLTSGPACFYAASVAAALEYLHSFHIVYRDLKPENLLLDHLGYLKVVDFGFAKPVFPGERTWTLCGTPEYLAPEIILRKGHDTRADWWSLGVLLIELLTGSTPFVSDDHFEIFKKAVKGDVDWPSLGMPPDAQAVAAGLLVGEPAERMGAAEVGGARTLKATPFFSQIDFVQLVGKKLPAPYVPHIESQTDTRHCQDEDDIELPEASAYTILAARKQLDLHLQFPEFELIDAEEAWAPSKAPSNEKSGESFSAPMAVPIADAVAAAPATPRAVVVDAPAEAEHA